LHDTSTSTNRELADAEAALAQFSLGSMLIVVGLLCVWLALTVNRAHRQRTAVAGDREAGRNRTLRRLHVPTWLQRLQRDAFVHVVDVISSNVRLPTMT